MMSAYFPGSIVPTSAERPIRSAALEGGGADGLRWGHAEFHHVIKLFGVVAVRIDAGVGAEGHLHSGFNGLLEILTLKAAHHFFFLDIFLGQSKFRRFIQKIVVVVDVHDEIGAVLFGKADAFVVDEAGVLDGIDASEDRVLDSFGAVGVSGDFAPCHVRSFGGDFEFFEGVLRGAGTVPFREHTPGGENLDDIDAVFHLSAHDVAKLIDAVGDLKVTFFRKHRDARLRREIVEVAVASGDGDARAAGDDARAGNQAVVDGVAQIDGEKRRGADIANGSESGFESFARVDHGEESVVEGCVLEAIDLVVAIGASAEMRVAIDESGEDGGLGKIDHGGTGWDLHAGCGVRSP